MGGGKIGGKMDGLQEDDSKRFSLPATVSQLSCGLMLIRESRKSRKITTTLFMRSELESFLSIGSQG